MHEEAPELAWYWPMAQVEHAPDDPTAAWIRPAAQLSHTVVAPVVEENWPVGQLVHSTTLVEAENLPAAHETQDAPDT